MLSLGESRPVPIPEHECFSDPQAAASGMFGKFSEVWQVCRHFSSPQHCPTLVSSLNPQFMVGNHSIFSLFLYFSLQNDKNNHLPPLLTGVWRAKCPRHYFSH